MNVTEIQQRLFQFVKSKLSSDSPVVDEVAKLLEISSDSAYRRIRGEKTISLDELYKIATHYHISIDQLMEISTGAFMFQGNLLNPQNYRYEEYLTGMIRNLAYFNSFKESEFTYLCKDTPIFHYFNSPVLAAFKYFFWMRTLVYFPEFRDRKVKYSDYPDMITQLGEKVIDIYSQIDSIEIWNIESWNTTLHQIDYYRDGQVFSSGKDIMLLYEAIELVVDHLEEQAARGYKFLINDPDKKPMGKYKMYFNEIVIQDNSMMALLDKSKIAMVPHTAINYMMTRDIGYCENYYQYVQNLMKRSTLISEVSEKERSRFFRITRERLQKRKDALKA